MRTFDYIGRNSRSAGNNPSCTLQSPGAESPGPNLTRTGWLDFHRYQARNNAAGGLKIQRFSTHFCLNTNHFAQIS